MFPGTRVGLQELWGFSKHGTPKTKRDGLWQPSALWLASLLMQSMRFRAPPTIDDPFSECCEPSQNSEPTHFASQKKDAKAEKLLSSWNSHFFSGILFPISFSINSCLLRPLPRLVPTPAQSFQISLKIQPFDIVRSPVILGLKTSFAINNPQMPDIAALLPVQNIAGSRFRPADG